MAHTARLSDVVIPAEVVETVMEGLAVSITGTGIHNLPALEVAASGAVRNVFIAFVPPDNFSRPTPEAMYTSSWYNVGTDSYNQPTTTGTHYEVGKSLFFSPTMASGELCQAHRGGTYSVPSGAFVDTAGVRVRGALIGVGDGGRWEEAASEAAAVGFVEEYDTVNNVLIFTLSQ